MDALFSFLISLNLSKLIDAWSFAIRFEVISALIGKCLFGLCVLTALALIGWLYYIDSE